MRMAMLVLGLIILAVGGWVTFGGFDRWSESRIAAELTERGLPPPMADCMASRMVDRLSAQQLAKLRYLSPLEGEEAVPLSAAALIERFRRIGDAEVVEVLSTAAAVCAFTAS